jgi:ribosomal protein S18 acetylase RimI-like enzyme
VTTRHNVHVVDLCSVPASDLNALWQYELQLWQDRLLWDISAQIAALRRIVRRGAWPGKVVQVAGRTVAYCCYGITGQLGVIAGLTVLPDWSHTEIGEQLLNSTLQSMQQQGVSRIESRFISVDCPWLGEALEAAGFGMYWREFLRCELHHVDAPEDPSVLVSAPPWQATQLNEAAAILQAAYLGSLEAEILALYRSVDGCRSVLDQIVNQGSCGVVVPEASLVAHDHRTSLGFAMVTEVACRQAHLPQLAVLPAYQGQGIGRALLSQSMQRLAERQYATLSLIVSRANDRALSLYRSMGFDTILTFPVGIWTRAELDERAKEARIL